MKIPVEKLKAMLRYFCTNTDPRYLGKTKLMKLFYFTDFLYVKRFGRPITYDTYYNLEHGPIPSTILNLINGVADEKEKAILSDTIWIESSPTFPMQKIKSFNKFSKADRSLFSEGELKALDDVTRVYGDKDTKYVVDASHNESPWKLTDETDEIPYTLAAEDHDCIVKKEDIELLQQLTNY